MKVHSLFLLATTILLYTTSIGANVHAHASILCSNEDIVATRAFINAKKFIKNGMRDKQSSSLASHCFNSIEQRYIALNIWHTLAMSIHRKYAHELLKIYESSSLSSQKVSSESFRLMSLAQISDIYSPAQALNIIYLIDTAAYSKLQLWGNIHGKTYFSIAYMNPYENSWADSYPSRWKIMKPFEDDQCEIDLLGVAYKPSPEKFNPTVFEQLLLCRMAKDLETAVTVLTLLEKEKDTPERATAIALAAQAVKDFACLLRKRLNTASYPLAVREKDPSFTGDPFAVFQGYQRQAEAAGLAADRALSALQPGN